MLTRRRQVFLSDAAAAGLALGAPTPWARGALAVAPKLPIPTLMMRATANQS